MIRRNRFLFAPDTGTSSGTAPAISAADSPTGVAIEVTPQPVQPAPEIHQPEPIGTKSTMTPGVKIKPIDVAKELGLKEAPSKLNERAAKIARDKLSGQFSNSPAAKRAATIAANKAKAAQAPPAKPSATITPPVAKGEPVPLGEPTPTPAAEPKIKIGNEEKTAAEWEAYHKELANPKPVEPVTPAEPEPDENELEAKFIAEAADRYTPTQEEFDKMLADGDTAAFGKFFAKVEMNTRKWVAAQVGPHIERLSGQLQPLAQQQERIAQFQTETQFLADNPTIKGHAEGLKTMRQTAEELRTEHAELEQIIRALPNSPQNTARQERCKALETNFLQELSKATQAKLGIQQQAAAPAAAATPTPPRSRPPAQTGQITGPAPTKTAGASGVSAEIAAMRKYGVM